MLNPLPPLPPLLLPPPSPPLRCFARDLAIVRHRYPPCTGGGGKSGTEELPHGERNVPRAGFGFRSPPKLEGLALAVKKMLKISQIDLEEVKS
jgi:hypothetical protein